MQASKDTLRHEALRHRDRIDAGHPDEDPDKARDLFFETFKPQPDQVIALYWPKGKEFDTGAILERLLTSGHQAALPVTPAHAEGGKILRFALWDESVPLVEGPFQIKQPVINDKTQWTVPDIVIVPLLAFDRRGYRLGYGGGYYDATLAALRAQNPDIVTIGLGYAQQAVLFNLPVEDHDQKLDWIITPQRVHCYKE